MKSKATREETYYDKLISKQKTLTHVEQIKLSKAYKAGDESAKDRMVIGNLRLVLRFAKTYQHLGVDYCDLIQEGNLGLIVAIEKFDCEMGYKFSTYAAWWIKRYLKEYVIANKNSFTVSAYRQRKLYKIEFAEKILSHKLGRMPSTLEISDYMGITIKQIMEARLIKEYKKDSIKDNPNKNDEPDSIDRYKINDSRDRFLTYEKLMTDSDQFVDNQEAQSVKNLLQNILTKQELDLLFRKHGVFGEELPIDEIGRAVGIGYISVNTILKRAERRAKFALEKLGITHTYFFSQ